MNYGIRWFINLNFTGLNQLLWYFSDLEKQKCYHLDNGAPDLEGQPDACKKWRRFAK